MASATSAPATANALGPDGTIYAGRYAPQVFDAAGSFLWSGDAPNAGERWSPSVITDEGLLFWTDAQGLSARICLGPRVVGRARVQVARAR